MAYRMYVRTTVPGLRRVAAHLGVDEQGDVQRLVTAEVVGRMRAYMPRRTGALEASLRRISDTLVMADSPYARAQFFGVTADGRPFRYDRTANPKAGPHWDRAMMAEQGEAIRAKAQRYVRDKERGRA